MAFKVRGQREKGEEVEAELQRQLGKLKGEVGKDFMDANAVQLFMSNLTQFSLGF